MVKRAWRTKYKTKKAPRSDNILCTVSRFKKTGSVLPNLNRRRDISQKRKAAKNIVENLVSKFPKLSLKMMAPESKISKSTTRKVLIEDLKRKPYKIQDYHQLKPADYQKRVIFAEWFLKLPTNSSQLIIMSDEAYFYLTESSNKQNNRVWLKERPAIGIERPLHDEKVLVFCAISAAKIYGPYFFSESVNQHNYLEMLKDWFWPKHLRTDSYKKYYFQQDGATPHTANSIQNWLSSKFGDKFVDKKKWSPRSPDLNLCDFLKSYS